MTQNQSFEIGDIVKLKSGGPDMTVNSRLSSTAEIYRCQWFAGKKLEGGNFEANSLEIVKKV